MNPECPFKVGQLLKTTRLGDDQDIVEVTEIGQGYFKCSLVHQKIDPLPVRGIIGTITVYPNGYKLYEPSNVTDK